MDSTDIDVSLAKKYPLCAAAGGDANAFEEQRLKDLVTSWGVLTTEQVSDEIKAAQILIMFKLINEIPLTPEDIFNCLLVQDLPGEKWRSLPRFNDQIYVSTLGRVKKLSVLKDGSVKIMILSLENHHGYARIRISDPVTGQRTHSRVHRLVLEAFKPKTEEDIRMKRNYVNHMNHNPLDNRVENLEWVNEAENTLHGQLYKLHTEFGIEYEEIGHMNKYYQVGFTPEQIAKFKEFNKYSLTVIKRALTYWNYK